MYQKILSLLQKKQETKLSKETKLFSNLISNRSIYLDLYFSFVYYEMTYGNKKTEINAMMMIPIIFKTTPLTIIDLILMKPEP